MPLRLQFHLETLIIYRLGLNQNHNTSLEVFLTKIPLCSKFSWTFIDDKCFDLKLGWRSVSWPHSTARNAQVEARFVARFYRVFPGRCIFTIQGHLASKKRLSLGPSSRPMTRALWLYLGERPFLLSEVPLYALHDTDGGCLFNSRGVPRTTKCRFLVARWMQGLRRLLVNKDTHRP